MTSALQRIAAVALRHRGAVIAAWCAVALAGLVAGVALPSRLTALTSVPASPSARADALLSARFGDNADGTFTVIVPFEQATDLEIRRMEHRVEQAVDVVPKARVVQQRALGGVLYALVGTRLDLLDASRATEHLRDALRRAGLTGAEVTGPPALEHDVRPVLAQDLQWGAGLAILLTLLLLGLALGPSIAVLVPLVVAAAVVSASLGAVFLMATGTQMVLYIPNVIELIGLGLAIDYSLLLLHRFRAEARVGDGDDSAVMRTMATAGRTVVVSGVTAAAGLSVLFIMPVPFIRSLGAAGLVVPVMSVIAATTLQPVLLSMLGSGRLGSHANRGILDSERALQRWRQVSTSVVRRPALAVGLTLLTLLALAAPLSGMHLAPASLTAVPESLESARAAQFLTARIGAGALTPHSVIIDTGRDGGAIAASGERARTALVQRVSRMPGVFAVVSDTTTLFVDDAGRDLRLVVIGRAGFDDDATQTLVGNLRALRPTDFGFPPGARVLVGGAAARGADFLHRVESSAPIIVLCALFLAYLLMRHAFRASLLPAVAVGLNLLSVAAACGVVVAIFQWGMGAQHIEAWSLVFLFAMLFGLSMDYQVFVVAGVREAREAGLGSSDAIVAGITRTAGVVTAAAVILVAALLGLVFGHLQGLQELGVGLASGVLIDAVLVRTLLLPGVMALLGDRGWGRIPQA